ncbi:MAG: CFI-box-CTERM domain-containing protein [Prolixibacteraceae bacterium]
MDFKTNYQFYTNYQLNTIANEIATELDEIDESQMAIMGRSNEVDITRAKQLVSKMKGNPTTFSMGLFKRNQSKLRMIQSSVGFHDDSLLQLGDKLGLTVCAILQPNVFLAHAMTEASGFKNSLNSPEVISSKQFLLESYSILVELSQLNVNPDVKNEIVALKDKVVELEKKYTSSAGGCYIATYVYGDYNSPEVLTLRLFRDNFLSEYALGRYFIKKYYIISPKLIAKYSENVLFRKVSKILVSCFVKLLNR